MIHKFEAFEFFKIHKISIDSVLDIGAHKGKWTQEFKKFKCFKFTNHLYHLTISIIITTITIIITA